MRGLVFLLLVGACMDRPKIGVDRTMIDLPRGAGADVAVTEDGAPMAIDDLQWLVGDPTIIDATRSLDGQHLHVTAISEGATALHVGTRDGVVVHVPVHVAPPAILAMWIEPATLTTTIGELVAVQANALDTTQTVRDVSAESGLHTMDPSVAAVDDASVRATGVGHTVLAADLAGTHAEMPITVE